MTGLSVFSTFKSVRILWIHTALLADELEDIYSASVDDKDTPVCFLDAHETLHPKTLNKKPDVDFRSSTSPAQSASAYPIRIGLSVWRSYFSVRSIVI